MIKLTSHPKVSVIRLISLLLLVYSLVVSWKWMVPTRTSRPPADFTHLRKYCADIPPISSSAFYSRHYLLGDALREIGAGAYILEPSPSALYYANVSRSQWKASERPFLIALVPSSPSGSQHLTIGALGHVRDLQVLLLTPKFERSRAKSLKIPSDSGVEYIEWAEDQDPYDALAYRIGRGHRVVLDEDMRVFVAQGLQNAGLAAFPEFPQEIRRLRERKSEHELVILRCVNQVTLFAVQAVREHLYIGVKESEAKALMTKALIDAGISAQGLFITAQFGENAALPHGGGTDKTLGVHDLSDLTRTIALRESLIPSRHLEIWNRVKEAQGAGLRAAREGVSAGDVDEAARAVIEHVGYGQHFTHRLGHGIGLELHESPYLRGGNPDALEIGNTFSVEPGVYIEGEVGIRLEDCVVIGMDGSVQVLTGGTSESPVEFCARDPVENLSVVVVVVELTVGLIVKVTVKLPPSSSNTPTHLSPSPTTTMEDVCTIAAPRPLRLFAPVPSLHHIRPRTRIVSAPVDAFARFNLRDDDPDDTNPPPDPTPLDDPLAPSTSSTPSSVSKSPISDSSSSRLSLPEETLEEFLAILRPQVLSPPLRPTRRHHGHTVAATSLPWVSERSHPYRFKKSVSTVSSATEDSDRDRRSRRGVARHSRDRSEIDTPYTPLTGLEDASQPEWRNFELGQSLVLPAVFCSSAFSVPLGADLPPSGSPISRTHTRNPLPRHPSYEALTSNLIFFSPPPRPSNNPLDPAGPRHHSQDTPDA
ncbi:hypothetical protein FRB99_005207 [Tulasnella sp. 403]|nr:hypothetical protein FRB99_005207 [Tulasnella sp. 403]